VLSTRIYPGLNMDPPYQERACEVPVPRLTNERGMPVGVLNAGASRDATCSAMSNKSSV